MGVMKSEILVDISRQWRLVACVGLAGFVFQFDAYQLNVCLPAIAREMELSSTEASFVILAYLLPAVSIFIPSGRLASFFGLKRVFCASVTLLFAGTMFCAIASGMAQLVFGRAVQGFGAGGMASLGYAAVSTMLPVERRGWGLGWLNLGVGAGMIVGLPLGGLLAEFISWQAIFIATLLPCSILVFFAFRWIPGFHADGGDKPSRKPFDSFGCILLTGGIGFLLLGLSMGVEWGWTSPAIVSSFLATLLFAVALMFWSRFSGREMISPALLGNRQFLASMGVLFLARIAFGGDAFLMPFYLQAGCGLGPGIASLVQLCGAVALVISAPYAGSLADRFGSRWLTFGSLMLAASAFAVFNGVLSSFLWLIPLILEIVLGFAAGFFNSPNSRHIIESAPDGKKTEAAALLPLALNLGSLVGICVMETVFSLGFPDGKFLPKGSVGFGGAIAKEAAHGFMDAYLFASAIMVLGALIIYRKYNSRQEDVYASN